MHCTTKQNRKMKSEGKKRETNKEMAWNFTKAVNGTLKSDKLMLEALEPLICQSGPSRSTGSNLPLPFVCRKAEEC